MLNQVMNTRTRGVAILAVATAMLTAVVYVPAEAKDKLLI